MRVRHADIDARVPHAFKKLRALTLGLRHRSHSHKSAFAPDPPAHLVRAALSESSSGPSCPILRRIRSPIARAARIAASRLGPTIAPHRLAALTWCAGPVRSSSPTECRRRSSNAATRLLHLVVALMHALRGPCRGPARSSSPCGGRRSTPCLVAAHGSRMLPSRIPASIRQQ